MKNFATTLILSLLTCPAFASQLNCVAKDKTNFLDGAPLTVSIVTDQKITVSVQGNPLLPKPLDGEFVRTTADGDSQYSVPDLSNTMDQSDAGKLLLSRDDERVTLALRFTDDDGPQSWYNAVYSCEMEH